MALVTGQVKRLPVPHEPDEWVDIRRLSWRQREEAETVGLAAAFQKVRGFDADLVAAMRPTAEAVKDVAVSGISLDQATVLRYGVQAWSYGATVSPATLDDLDAQTADWLYAEIVALAQPATAAERGNA